MLQKAYLGDAVYAEWDGYQITLHANEPDSLHMICLDHDVMTSLAAFYARCREQGQETKP